MNQSLALPDHSHLYLHIDHSTYPPPSSSAPHTPHSTPTCAPQSDLNECMGYDPGIFTLRSRSHQIKALLVCKMIGFLSKFRTAPCGSASPSKFFGNGTSCVRVFPFRNHFFMRARSSNSAGAIFLHSSNASPNKLVKVSPSQNGVSGTIFTV